MFSFFSIWINSPLTSLYSCFFWCFQKINMLFVCSLCICPLKRNLSQMVIVVKNLSANAGDTGDAGSIPGSGRSSGVGHVKALQYSYLENPMNRGAWLATVYGLQRVGWDWSDLAQKDGDWVRTVFLMADTGGQHFIKAWECLGYIVMTQEVKLEIRFSETVNFLPFMSTEFTWRYVN